MGQHRTTSPSVAHSAERGWQAVQLRAQRKTFDQIARELGYSDRGAARKAYVRHLEFMRTETPEAEALRVAESEYLNNLRDKIADGVEVGDLSSIDRAVRISERFAKLNGLDLNESRTAGALEAGAVASLMASSNLHAGIIAAMGRIGMPLEMQDRLIAAINEWLAEQETDRDPDSDRDESDRDRPDSDELVIITGEVDNR